MPLLPRSKRVKWVNPRGLATRATGRQQVKFDGGVLANAPLHSFVENEEVLLEVLAKVRTSPDSTAILVGMPT